MRAPVFFDARAIGGCSVSIVFAGRQRDNDDGMGFYHPWCLSCPRTGSTTRIHGSSFFSEPADALRFSVEC